MNPFQHRRVINASPETIFGAYEDPALLAQWWGPRGFSCTFSTFEFRSQGHWSFVMQGPDGVSFPNENQFVEIVRPSKVSVRHLGLPLFTVTLEIEASGAGSRITWTQAFDDDKVAESLAALVQPANEQVLDKLQALVIR